MTDNITTVLHRGRPVRLHLGRSSGHARVATAPASPAPASTPASPNAAASGAPDIKAWADLIGVKPGPDVASSFAALQDWVTATAKDLGCDPTLVAIALALDETTRDASDGGGPSGPSDAGPGDVPSADMAATSAVRARIASTLTKRELDKCKALGIDVAKYAEKKAAIAARSGATR